MGKMMQFWWQASETLPLQNIKLWWIPYNNSVLSVQCSIIQWTMGYKYSLFLKLTEYFPWKPSNFLIRVNPRAGCRCGQSGGRGDTEGCRVVVELHAVVAASQSPARREGESPSPALTTTGLEQCKLEYYWRITTAKQQSNYRVIYFNILASAQTHFQNYKYCVLFLTRRQCNGAEYCWIYIVLQLPSH